PDHLFHVPGRGFAAAGSLKLGDPVSRASPEEPISTSSLVHSTSQRADMSDVLRVNTLTFENQPFWAYNLEVAEDHTFFVGASRAWVHNDCGKVIANTRGLLHSFGSHAAQWFGREVKASTHLAEWEALIERTSASSLKVPWSTGADRTV